MRAWVASLVLAAVGATLLARGNLGALMLIVCALLIAWPGEYGAGDQPERYPDHDDDVDGREAYGPAPSRRTRLLFWALAVVLLWTLIIGVGLIGYFVLGWGSPLGLAIGATMVVLSVRFLYRIEPRT
jgi:hypothetical protein